MIGLIVPLFLIVFDFVVLPVLFSFCAEDKLLK